MLQEAAGVVTKTWCGLRIWVTQLVRRCALAQGAWGWRGRAVAIVGMGHSRDEAQAVTVCVNAGLAALSVTCQRNIGNYSQNYSVIFLFVPFRLAFKSTSPLHGRCTVGATMYPICSFQIQMYSFPTLC